MAKYLVTNIEWDIDEKDLNGESLKDILKTLPSEITIDAEDEYDSLSNAISDEYGYCVLNYSSEEIFV